MSRDYIFSILNSDLLVDDIENIKDHFELKDSNIERCKKMTVIFFENLQDMNKFPEDLKAIDIASIFICAIEKYRDVSFEISKKDGSLLELKSNATFLKCLMDSFNAIYYGRMDAIDMLAKIDEMESSILDDDEPTTDFGTR